MTQSILAFEVHTKSDTYYIQGFTGGGGGGGGGNLDVIFFLKWNFFPKNE